MGGGDLMIGEIKRASDGLVNVAASLGTWRSKGAHNEYRFTPRSHHQLLASYRSSWLSRAIVSIPAEDATRKWRSWVAEEDQITAIERIEKRLQLPLRMQDALKAARLYGGAAIYISTGDLDPSQPLDPSRVRDLRQLTVLTPMDLRPEEASRDIESRYYRRPEFYDLASVNGTVRIHASRLVVLAGEDVPGGTTASGWGDSVLHATREAIEQADSANVNVSELVYEAKVDVFRFQGLMRELGSGGPETDDQLVRRLSAQAAIKGINGAVVLDKEDEYEQKSASFASLPEVMDRFMTNVAGAARIPVTRLFGRAAVGLSGTGDGDERTYFDHIQHLQTTQIEPALHLLDECIIWQAIGSRPPEVFYNWRPLRQLTEQDRADVFAKTATAARALAGPVAGELVPLDALSDSLVNELVEQGVLPGLEAKVKEYGTLTEQGLAEGGDDAIY